MQSYQRFFNIYKRRFTPTIINVRLYTRKPPLAHISKLDHIFGKYLWITNTLVSGILLGVGDGIQQQLEIYFEEKKELDWKRIRNMFIVGTVIGLPQHYFYYFMDKALPKTNWNTVKYKILLDQVIASPACIFMFLAGMELSQGNTLQQGLQEFNSKFLSIYIVDLSYWPPLQFLNFYFISPKYRVFYVNFATMIYNIFLSYAKFHSI